MEQEEGSPEMVVIDEAVSESFLSLFKMDSSQARMTEEEEELERANMTDEERASALSDMFVKYCSLNSHQSKRPRQDLDNKSIGFLIDQMRLQLEHIPREEKQALIVAQEKCEALSLAISDLSSSFGARV